MKLDPIVKKETGYMALGCLACTAVLVLVFVFLGKFDTSVALGCLIGYVLAVGNFFLMSYSLTKALAHGDEVTAKLKMRQSYVARSVVMLVLMGAAIVVEWVHWVPVVAAVFYPQLVIFVRGIVQKVRTKSEPAAEPAADQTTSAAAWEDDEEETDEFEKFVSGFSKTPIPKPEPHSESLPAEPEEPAQQAEPKE